MQTAGSTRCSPSYIAWEVEDLSTFRPSEESSDLRFFPRDGLPTDVIATQRPIIERYISGAEPPFLD